MPNLKTPKSTAKVITDSMSPSGHRLTTMEVRMHRFVLAEFDTHRRFSRNSASSRAIPVEKQLERIRQDPAYPVSWPCEQPGMSGGAELSGGDLEDAELLWMTIKAGISDEIRKYLEAHPDKSTRLHKSLLNRWIEPVMWHTVIVSSTEWENFFRQRCSSLAQPEIRAAADAMRQALHSSIYVNATPGYWHLPYIDTDELIAHSTEECKRVSVARCARVSYLTHDGERDWSKDLEMYDKLVSADPPHASPLEHVATPVTGDVAGNFDGWHQLRHLVLGF